MGDHEYVSVGIEQVCLDAIIALRGSLVARLVAKGQVYFARVEDGITVVHEGQMYRAAYIDKIQCTGFRQTKHRPTGAPRHQYDAIWMHVNITELEEYIPDPDAVGNENMATPISTQIQWLLTAIADYESGSHVSGTLGSGGTHGHLILREMAAWPNIESIRDGDGALQDLREKFQPCLAQYLLGRLPPGVSIGWTCSDSGQITRCITSSGMPRMAVCGDPPHEVGKRSAAPLPTLPQRSLGVPADWTFSGSGQITRCITSPGTPRMGGCGDPLHKVGRRSAEPLPTLPRRSLGVPADWTFSGSGQITRYITSPGTPRMTVYGDPLHKVGRRSAEPLKSPLQPSPGVLRGWTFSGSG